MIGVQVPDLTIWEMVKSGEFNGFSLDGDRRPRGHHGRNRDSPTTSGRDRGAERPPPQLHREIRQDGNFLGGRTGPGPDGHIHEILRGTTTEAAKNHSHRFSFVEGVLSAQVAH